MHHSPNPGDGDAASIARILNSSDRIAKLLCEVPDPDEVAEVCTSATAFIGADVEDLVRLLPSIENDIEELAEVLRIDVISSNVYSLIAKSVQEKLAAPAHTE